ncbi:MAG: hypothetical protein LBE31_12075 [Deltaproteobacteria bacterium]|jgi:3-deoxy-D-manno-octulosonic-acid transferase|nr:hypothetical protein [Deltaproteobacteria bacterium]
MRTFYTVIYTLAFCLATPYWLIRGLFNRVYLKNLRARFIGPGKVLPKLSGQKRVWVWALSLGEVLSARELVKKLVEDGFDVVITSTTLSGLATAKANWPKLPVFPSPLDFNLSTRRFLDLVKPDALILVETDIWPGILLQMQKRGLPKFLVSARLSPRSYRNYRRIRFFWRKVLNLFDLIATQTVEDRDLFLELGASPTRVKFTGNLKFDQPDVPLNPEEKQAILRETGWPDGRWLVAGSTHMGEETMIMRAFNELWPKHRDLRLLIAPRDRHKFQLNWRLIREMFPNDSARRSQPTPSDLGAQVFLLDTLGDLERYYSLAEIALIGKSWPGSHEGGGHNPLEASVHGKAVIAGPKVSNFKWMYRALIAAGGALQADTNELTSILDELLSDPNRLSDMGQKAHEFVITHRGAVAETLSFLSPLLFKS